MQQKHFDRSEYAFTGRIDADRHVLSVFELQQRSDDKNPEAEQDNGIQFRAKELMQITTEVGPSNGGNNTGNSIEASSHEPLPPIRRSISVSTQTTESIQIDKFVFALLYIQWLAYGNSSTYEVSWKWPREVEDLHSHCRGRILYLEELHTIMDYIVKYTPQQWTGYSGHYLNDLKENIRELWRAALKSPGSIQQDRVVLLEYYASFSHWAKENDLICRVVIRGWNTPTPYLAFKAQGRLPTKKRHEEDEALLKLLEHVEGNSSSC